MPTNKFNTLLEAFSNLETAMAAIVEMWNDKQLAEIIDESNDVYPFDKSFDDEIYTNVRKWCNSVSDNVRKNYLRIPQGGDGYCRYDIISNDFCYYFDGDDHLDTEWVYDCYFNYMYYGTHDETIEAQFDTLEEAEIAFQPYIRGKCPITIDKKNHTVSGRIYYIQLNCYDKDGNYETDGNVYGVVTGLGYYGMENE